MPRHHSLLPQTALATVTSIMVLGAAPAQDEGSAERGFESYLYLEPSEARLEFLAPLNLLDSDTANLSRDARDLLLPKLAERLQNACRVHADGTSAEFEQDRIGFVTIDPERGPVPDERPEVKADDALVAAIFVAPRSGFPKLLELEWLYFPETVTEVDVAVEALSRPGNREPEFSHVLEFTKDDPRQSLSLPEIEASLGLREVPPVVSTPNRWPWIVAGLFLVAGVLLVAIGLRNRGGERSSFLTTAIIALVFAGGAFLQAGKVSSVEIPDDEGAGDLVEVLLSNVYKAFSHRDESDIYDVLEESIDGPLLEEVYLDIRRGVEEAENGGPSVRVLDVAIIDCLVQPGGDRGGLSAQVAWACQGTVSHWGHMHARRNKYRAKLLLEPVDDQWKITGVDVLSEERLE